MALCNNIIVPLDGSKLSAQALPAARLMANATHAPVTLVRSFGRLPHWYADTERGRFSAAMAAGEHDRTLADLAGVKRRMEHWGVEPPIFVEAHEGPAHEAIISLADRDPHAMIVMSTHGRGGPLPYAHRQRYGQGGARRQQSHAHRALQQERLPGGAPAL